MQIEVAIDGNMRVGAATTDVFLAMNNIQLTADQDEYAELVLAVARGETSKSAAAEFLRVNVRRL
jgi:prophage maintenance system killer protein